MFEYTPEVMKQLQDVISYPDYQLAIKQQKILNNNSLYQSWQSILVDYVLNPPSSLKNINLGEFKVSSDFISSAVLVQSSAINFFEQAEKLDPEHQKFLIEFARGLNFKTENEFPEDFPEEIKNNYLEFEDNIKNFWKKNKNDITGILSSIYPTFESIQNQDFSNIFSVLLFIYFTISFLKNQFDEKK